jgi:hypothetical protein
MIPTGCSQASPHVAVCSRDAEISAEDRRAIDEVAMAFVDRIYANDAAGAFNSMSPAAQDDATRRGLDTVTEAARAYPGDQRRVHERYMLRHVGAESGHSPCIEGDRVTTLANGGGAQTAFALVTEALGGRAERTWTLWLNLDGGTWRVRAFNVGLSAVAARSANDFVEEGLRQEREGHSFNATILFDLANQASDRGSFFVSADRNRVAAIRRDRQRHPDLVGDAPYTFVLGDQRFSINAVRPIADSQGEFALVLVQTQTPWRGQDEAERSNRTLIDAMNAHRSEWREVFDALIVQTPMDEPRRSWGTVYGRDEGYRSPAP